MHGFFDIFATGFDHNVVNMQHVSLTVVHGVL